MKLMSKHNIIAWIVIIFSTLCLSYSCCLSSSRIGLISKRDATHLKRNSFTLVEVSHSLIATRCLGENDICKDAPTGIEVRSMQARGSGVVVGHRREMTYIMTAGHVCEHRFPELVEFDGISYATKPKTKIIFYDLYGASHSGIALYVDLDTDVCIVESKGTWGDAVEIAEEMPRHGERVFNIAAPFGIYSPQMVLLFEGYYSGTDMGGNEFFTIPCRPGSSGSPVFNSDGELISIIHSASPRFENLGLGSRLEIVRATIEAHVPAETDVTVHYIMLKETQ